MEFSCCKNEGAKMKKLIFFIILAAAILIVLIRNTSNVVVMQVKEKPEHIIQVDKNKEREVVVVAKIDPIVTKEKNTFQKKNKGYEIQRKTAGKANAKRKQEIKTRREWIVEAQQSFNKFIRIRDTLDPCISCGTSRADIDSRRGWKVG